MYRATDKLSRSRMTGNGEIALMTATGLLDRFRARDQSPVAAVEAALERIDALNDRINAFCLVDHDAALSDARATSPSSQLLRRTRALECLPQPALSRTLRPQRRQPMVVAAAAPQWALAPAGQAVRTA